MAELKKYYADNHNALLLENIMQFAANITLKDKNAEDAAETDQSRFFRDILKKYYEDRLNFSDIIALKKFVDNYNSVAETTVKNIFSKKTTEDLLKDIFRVSVQTIDGHTYLYDLSTDKKNSFLANFKSYSDSISNEDENTEVESTSENSDNQINNNAAEIDYSADAIEIVDRVIKENSGKILELIKIIDPSEKPKTDAITNYIRVYLLNYFIHYSVDYYVISGTNNEVLNVDINKDSPDEYEKQDISNEFSVMSIVTSFALNSNSKLDLANQYFKINDNSITLNNTYGIRFNVVYKELNPYRREIGSSSLFESIISTALL